MARPGGPRGNGRDFDNLLAELPGLSDALARLRAAGPLLPGLIAAAVFLLWLVEGRFPQAMAVQSQAELEEERRLFYVAVTRAKDHLYLCQPRFEEVEDGPRRILRLSRFVTELGKTHPPYDRWEVSEAC